MTETTYIVAGHMRTGTSMMMRALIAGGLTPSYDPRRDEILNRENADHGYKPNAAGFFELERDEYLMDGFPRRHFGKLIKVLGYAVGRMVVGQYRVVFMRRHPEEIRQSFEAFFRTDQHPPSVDRYEDWVDDIIGILRNRKDVVDLIVLDYREVVDDPRAAFDDLRCQGWPINVDTAAMTVDPEKCRFKLEELTIGI